MNGRQLMDAYLTARSEYFRTNGEHHSALYDTLNAAADALQAWLLFEGIEFTVGESTEWTVHDVRSGARKVCGNRYHAIIHAQLLRPELFKD